MPGGRFLMLRVSWGINFWNFGLDTYSTYPSIIINQPRNKRPFKKPIYIHSIQKAKI